MSGGTTYIVVSRVVWVLDTLQFSFVLFGSLFGILGFVNGAASSVTLSFTYIMHTLAYCTDPDRLVLKKMV